MLAPLFLLADSFKIVHKELITKIWRYIYWSTWWFYPQLRQRNIANIYVTILFPIQGSVMLFILKVH